MATLKRNDSFNFFVFFRKASGGKNENFRLAFPLNETLPPGENPKSLLLSVPYPKQELFHSSELYSFQFTFDGSCGISLYISLTSIVTTRRRVEEPQCTPKPATESCQFIIRCKSRDYHRRSNNKAIERNSSRQI